MIGMLGKRCRSARRGGGQAAEAAVVANEE
jgi:hypothetical protein